MRSLKVAAVELELVVVIPELEEVVDVGAEAVAVVCSCGPSEPEVALRGGAMLSARRVQRTFRRFRNGLEATARSALTSSSRRCVTTS